MSASRHTSSIQPHEKRLCLASHAAAVPFTAGGVSHKAFARIRSLVTDIDWYDSQERRSREGEAPAGPRPSTLP